jgi:hypothetical protein
MSQPPVPRSEPQLREPPKRPIRWGAILAIAAVAYLVMVAVARPDFLRFAAPVMPGSERPPKPPTREDLLKDPAVLKLLREMRQKQETMRGAYPPAAANTPTDAHSQLNLPGPPAPEGLLNAPLNGPPPNFTSEALPGPAPR